jgi:uncharacterized Rmd1/YagE family protein
MTVQDMHNEFKLSLDKVDSSAYPEILDWEIDFFLNEAQDRFVKTRYGRNNIYVKGFEETQKRTDDLKALVVSKFCSLSTTPYYGLNGSFVYRAELDSLFDDENRSQASNAEYMLYVKAVALTTKPGCGDKWHNVKLVQQDDLSSITGDPFNKPNAERPIIFFEDGDIFVWSGSESEVSNFLVTCVKRPVQISLGTYNNQASADCELSEYTHKEIVQYAVKIAIENIESQRTASNQQVNVNKLE